MHVPARRPALRSARRAAAVVLTALALALAGCGGDAVRSGAAAVVGGERIPTTQLAQYVQAGLSDPAAQAQLGGDRPAYQRDVLSRLIFSSIVEEAARRRGVTVTESQVEQSYARLRDSTGGEEQLRQRAAAAGLSLERVRDIARTQALTDALLDAETRDLPVPDAQLREAYEQRRSEYDQVRVAQILLPSLQEAERLLPQARGLDAGQFADLARRTSTDAQTRDRGGDLGLAPREAFASVQLDELGDRAFRADVGDTLTVRTARGGHVVRVLERRTVTFEQAVPELRRELLRDRGQAAVTDLLRSTARDLGVSVNPRFGRWDEEQLQVAERAAAGDRQVSSPSAPPAAPAQEEELLDVPPEG